MKKLLITAVVAASLLIGFTALPAHAQGVWDVCPDSVKNSSAICGDQSQATDIVKRIVNVFLFVIGMLAVIMIIHSGLKYTSSRGDAEMIKSAKNTLLYAVTGLIVAMSAFAIVNFVLGAFSGTSGTGSSENGNPSGNNNYNQSGQQSIRGEDGAE